MLKRNFPQLLLVVLFVGSATIGTAQEALPDLVNRVKPSEVPFKPYDAKGEALISGSGFFLRPGQVLTNLHVVRGAQRAEIKTLDGKGRFYPVTGLLGTDEEADLALLSVNVPVERSHTVTLGTALPDEGERVFVIGNPLRLEGSVSDGIVSAIREVPEIGNVIQITAPISHGSSGSPVFNMKGEVIGVVIIKVTNGQNINMAMGVSRLDSLTAGELVTLDQRNSRPKTEAKEAALSE